MQVTPPPPPEQKSTSEKMSADSIRVLLPQLALTLSLDRLLLNRTKHTNTG